MCVWQCLGMHVMRVCCVWQGMCGGLWGMWIGHGGVVADPHTPTMVISSMHGWGWGVAAVVSAVGVCGCVRVVQQRAQGWGAAAQAHLGSAAPSSAGSAHPMPELPQKTCAYRHHSQQRPWGQVGITSPPVADSGMARTCVCGCAHFCAHQFVWCLV